MNLEIIKKFSTRVLVINTLNNKSKCRHVVDKKWTINGTIWLQSGRGTE